MPLSNPKVRLEAEKVAIQSELRAMVDKEFKPLLAQVRDKLQSGFDLVDLDVRQNLVFAEGRARKLVAADGRFADF